MQDLFAVFIVILIVFLAYESYTVIYFKSKNFRAIKSSIEQYTKNCNDLNDHIEELKSSYLGVRAFDYGESQLYDDSNYKMKRRRWMEEEKSHRTHSCSASVVKNASNQPFKYLCKYFNIGTNEESLSTFEGIQNNFSAAEEGKVLLKNERDSIVSRVSSSIPRIILAFSEKRVIQELGFNNIDLSDVYFPIYTFQYVSAGGNSSAKCDVKLDVSNLDKFVIYLSDLVKFKNSVAGQRALMTSGLREKIKNRDNFTCKICSLSVADEKNLLLEIDHIIPISKGGMTTEENLQTLCWKCNRSKGAKILSA